MSKGLPLEVLGLISPFLCLAEGGERRGLPEHWRLNPKPFEEHEKAWLQRELPTYSYDNLDEILAHARSRFRKKADANWHPEVAGETRNAISPPTDFDIMDAFRRLSHRYMSWNGNELFIREGLLVELHELGLRFPVRHLIRYCQVEAAVRGFLPSQDSLNKSDLLNNLHTLYHGLRAVIRKGLFEGHLHMNSILSPHETWANHLLCGHVFLEGMDTQAWRLVMLGRRSIRLMALGLLLNQLHSKNQDHCFHLLKLLDEIFYADTQAELKIRAEAFDRKFSEHRQKINQLLKVQRPLPAEELNWLIQILWPSFARLHTSHAADSDLYDKNSLRGQIKILNALHYYMQSTLMVLDIFVPWQIDEDPLFGTEFKKNESKQSNDKAPLRRFLHETYFRYLIFQTLHWQGATQSGKTTGLRHFTGKYFAKQRKTISNKLEAAGLAFERMANQEALKGVEGRISPPETPEKALHWILAFAKQYRAEKLDKFGLVVHFIKSDKLHLPSISNALPSREVRQARIRRKIRQDAMGLYRFLSISNPVAPFIVGIDAANLELTTPPEIFAPAFRFLREYPIKSRPKNSFKKFFGKHNLEFKNQNQKRLGMTYHVGEDFRHLLSGLRAIHEVIEFLNPIAGDRLGHATALALSPKVWLTQNGYQAILPKQEWLDTLVWVHHFLGSGHPLIDRLKVVDRIQRLSRTIYGSSTSAREVDDDWSIPSLYDSWRLRQLDPYAANLNHFFKNNEFTVRSDLGANREFKRWMDIQDEVLRDANRYVGSNAAYKLLALYWYNPEVKANGDQLMKVDMHNDRRHWIKVCAEAQQQMIDLVARKQLVVEANPTSNRLIGPMSSFGDHPIFTMTLDEKNQLRQKIRVTVNTDNPGVMATSLAHEFYLLGEILLSQGVSEPDVGTWLEWLRNNGESCSFLNLMPNVKKEDMNAFFDSLDTQFKSMSNVISGRESRYKPLIDQTLTSHQEARDGARKDSAFRALEEEVWQLRMALDRIEKKDTDS